MRLKNAMRAILSALERACEALGSCEIEHEVIIRRSAHMNRRKSRLRTTAKDERETLAIIDHGQNKEGPFPLPSSVRWY